MDTGKKNFLGMKIYKTEKNVFLSSDFWIKKQPLEKPNSQNGSALVLLLGNIFINLRINKVKVYLDLEKQH